MSTDSRRARTRARRSRGFGIAFAAVAGVLLVLGVTGAALSLAQGPRLTGVQVDPATAVEASGSRMILTANQALEPVTADQVTVTPAVPFTVDASGRSIGIRFTVPLFDDTAFSVEVQGVEGIGGGPPATLASSFETPPAEIFLLQRAGAGDDAIFRTDLAGDRAVPVFTHPHIEEFRATASRLVVSVIEDDGSAALLQMTRTGEDVTSLALPGDGDIAELQVSNRGDLVGYSYSDRELTDDTGRASVVFTQSLRDADAEPRPLEIAGSSPSVVEWRFVPDATAVLLLDFDGELLLTDPTSDGDPTTLGAALTIDGITNGTFEAIIERIEGGLRVVDLTDASEAALVAADGQDDLGAPASVVPVSGGGTVRTFTTLGPTGLPDGQTIAAVDDAGAVEVLAEIPGADVALQVCVSPNGRYAAVLVAPDTVDNPYDGYLQPLPETLETRIIEIDGARTVSALTGFDISWCPVGAA